MDPQGNGMNRASSFGVALFALFTRAGHPLSTPYESVLHRFKALLPRIRLPAIPPFSATLKAS